MTETPARRWPKTGNVGASTTLRDDEQPVTIPARPYPGEFAQLREATLDTVAEAYDLPRDLVAKMANPAPTPPTPAELREIAEELNAHGGLDETFVAGLLREAATDGDTWYYEQGGADDTAAYMAGAVHQHIWTTSSPMRCVECRRYLRPWWRRVLDRVRRWGR